MSLTSSNKVDAGKVELEITVDQDAFQKAVSDAFRKNAKRINVPGFRKGKAPRHIIEQYYGEGVFYEDAVNAVYPSAYEDAVKEAGIDPVDRADIEVVSVGKEGLKFKAKVTVKPEVEIGAYKGLNAVKKIYTVGEAEVDHEIGHIRERNARIITVEDRAAQKGDSAVIDYEGFLDGTPFEGGKDEKHELELGSGSFIPGFEEQVEGHKTGEEFDVNVTFPEQYHAKELAGKPVVFKVKLHEIKAHELPELDDEFAKDVSEFDTLEAYKEDVKKHLQESQDEKSKSDLEDALLDQVIGTLKAEIPEVMIENEIDHMVNDFDYRLQMQGLNVKTYLQYTGMEMAAFRSGFKESAEKQVKIRLALEKIAKLENLEASDEETEAEYKKDAERYNVDLAKIKDVLRKEDVVHDILMGKAIDLVKEQAVVTEEAAPIEPHHHGHDDGETEVETEAEADIEE